MVVRQTAGATHRLDGPGGPSPNGPMESEKTLPHGSPKDRALAIGGYLYARDFPELVREIKAKGPAVLGMSYEIADAKIDDLSSEVWAISDFTFTGAAVLRRDKAAYRETWIEIGG